MSTTLFVIGGPAYREQVDYHHAVSLAVQAAISVDSTTKIAEFDYRHSSMLHIIRCQWLRDHIGNDNLRYAVSVDSDVSWNAKHLDHVMKHHKPMAIGIAPCRIGGTDLANVNTIDGATVARARVDLKLSEMVSAYAEIESGGFGLVVFDLEWFRRNWPLPEPGTLDLVTGEDIAFCREVRKRGGKVRLLPVETTHYAWRER